MSLFEKRYTISTWYGEELELTAKKIYEMVLEDSKSNYNWFASASELVGVCQNPSFPIQFAIPIKIAILNCFANIEYEGNCGFGRNVINSDDEKAITECYTSLYDIDLEEAMLARKHYLTEVISKASYVPMLFDPLYHPGPTFRKLREEWISSKVEKYISQKTIDFKQLIGELHSDFAEMIKTAEANGEFSEDEKRIIQERQTIFKGVFDI